MSATVSAQQPDTLIHSLTPLPTGVQTGAQSGYSIAVDEGYIVVGTPLDDIGAMGSGVVKIFDSSTGDLLFVIPNPSPAATDTFGHAVAVSGSRVVIGAPGDDTGATDTGSAYVYDLRSAAPMVPLVTLNHPSPAASDQFGSAVAISGNRVVVGAYQNDTGGTNAGRVYVYDLDSSTPDVPAHALNNPSPVVGDNFGWSVGISGARMVICAYSDDTGALNAGSAYVYDLGSGTPTVPTHTLNNPGPALNDTFGSSVAISGTRLVVGTPSDDTGMANAGSAYVYDLSSGTPLVPVATLNNPAAASGDSFGSSVAISGTRVAVGALVDDAGASDAGSVYVYELASAAPTVPAVVLGNPTPADADRFGRSVAIFGTQLAVGASQDDTVASDAGSAYLYDLESGTPAVPTATLSPPGPGPGDRFGYAVAASGKWVIVGAYGDDTGGTDAGSAYVYDMTSSTPTVPVFILHNPTPEADDQFGYCVAAAGTLVVVGAYADDTGQPNAGSAYVYDLSSGTPTVPMTVLNHPLPVAGDNFGWSVAISGTQVVVGAHLNDIGANAAGSAYVYDLASATPTVPLVSLQNPSPVLNDNFGWSVAISGMWVAVAAHQDDTGASDSGSVYVYDLGSGTPAVPVHTLNNPVPSASDYFGRSVAISGMRVLVGAYADDTGANGAGSAYIYELGGVTPAVPVLTLTNPNPAVNESFGWSVALSDTFAVIGAYGDSTGAVSAGSTYVYELGSGTPTVPVATLNNPGPAVADYFGWSVAISGTRLVVGASMDDLLALDKGAAFVHDSSAVVTLPPVLVSPGSTGTAANSINVSFSLPEAALPGSVKLSFGATQLTLATSQETAGPHSFTFAPANPTVSPEIASGIAIADGTYTVALRYQDVLGNPSASATSYNMKVDMSGPLGGSMTLAPASPVAASSGITVSFGGWDDVTPPLSHEVYIDDTIIGVRGPPGTRTLTAPSTPGNYTLKGRIYDALGNLTETTRILVVVYTPQQKFANAMTAASLSGPDAQPTATPEQDGVANLLKYAFNLDLSAPDRRTLVPGSGTAGLPSMTLPSPGVLRIEYLRRIGSGLSYTPQKRAGLDAGAWQPLASLPVVTPVLNEPDWERVVHEEPFNPATTLRLFGRVEVTLP